MSRCTICNVVMTEQELTHKDPLTGDYTDMCFDCINEQEALMNDSDEKEVLYVHNSGVDSGGDFDQWD